MANREARTASVVARALVLGALAAAAAAFIVALIPSSIGGVTCPSVLGNGGAFITETGAFECAAATSGKAGAVWFVWILAAGALVAAATVKGALPEPDRRTAQQQAQGSQ